MNVSIYTNKLMNPVFWWRIKISVNNVKVFNGQQFIPESVLFGRLVSSRSQVKTMDSVELVSEGMKEARG
jgi:hypothetical protein